MWRDTTDQIILHFETKLICIVPVLPLHQTVKWKKYDSV